MISKRTDSGRRWIVRLAAAGLSVGTIASGLAFTGTSASASAKKGQEGWGPKKAFVGRYHVKIPSGPLHSAKGQLTLFMQEEFPHAPLTPAGILSLHTKSGTQLLYLTSLTAKGKSRRATVTGGDFSNGPTLGSFSGSSTAAGHVSGTVKARGVGTFRVTFTRFSKTPQP